MRMTWIAATALTLSAAAFAQDYGNTPVDDSSSVTQPDSTLDTSVSDPTVHADHDPMVDDIAPDATTTAPANPDASIADATISDTTLATDTTVATDTAATANLQTFAGMGGPYEEVYGSAAGSLNLAPRPASQNYPPCDPGPSSRAWR